MEFNKSLEILKNNKDVFKYIVIDEIQNCINNTTVCVGHIAGNYMFNNTMAFRLTIDKLKALTDALIIDGANSIKTNYIFEGNKLLTDNVGECNNTPIYNDSLIVSLDRYIEPTIFHLLAYIAKVDGYLEMGDWKIPIHKLKFSTKKYSITATKKEKTWISKVLLSYDLEWHLEDFNFVVPKNVDKLCGINFTKKFEHCIEVDPNQEKVSKDFVRYRVDIEELCVCPVEMSYMPMVFSKDLFLSAESESKYNNLYIKGIDLFSSIMRESLDCVPLVWYTSSSKSNKISGDTFTLSDFTDSCNIKKLKSLILLPKNNFEELILNYYQTEDAQVLEDILNVLRKYIKDPDSELVIKGFIDVLLNTDYNYTNISNTCTTLKDKVNKRDIYLKLTYYYWRAIFTENRPLISRLFGILNRNFMYNEGCKGHILNGGVFGEEFVIL